MRAGLAALGIFIGTTTVIWLVAMGEGVSYRGSATDSGTRGQQHHCPHEAAHIVQRRAGSQFESKSLRPAAERLRSHRRECPPHSPYCSNARGSFRITTEQPDGGRQTCGVCRGLPGMNHLKIARGRWLTRRDRGKKVVVLADDTAKRLFPFENPIGRTIWVGSEFYVVIGQNSIADVVGCDRRQPGCPRLQS